MNRTTKTHRLHMQNLAAGELRDMQERIDARQMAAPAWPFDPETAYIFDILVSPAPADGQIRVDVTVREEGGPNTYTRLMANNVAAWASLVPMAGRAAYGLTDRVGGAL